MDPLRFAETGNLALVFIIGGPVYDREELLLANLDLGEVVRGKYDFDASGHYARPDVLQLLVNGQPAE